MAKKPNDPKNPTRLRRQAEELLRTTKRDVAAMPVRDVQQLVHELQVFQIELEMQNEELRLAQRELEAARDRYLDLYEFSPAGHLTLDRDATIVEANLRAGQLLGTDRKDLIEQPLSRFLASEAQDRFHRHCQEVLRTGTRQSCEVQIRKKTGVSDYIYLESLAVHEEVGHITHWRTSLLDISAHKRAEEEMQSSEAFLNSILENLPNMVFVKEVKDLRFVRVNKAGEDLLGYFKDELMGKNDFDFFPRDEADFFTAKDREVLASRRLMDIPEEPIQTRSGEVRYLHTRKIPIVGQDGMPKYLLGISEDITERKQTDEELAERVRLSGFIAEASLSLNRDMSLTALLQQLTDAIVTRLGCAFARIWTVGPGDLCEHCHKVEWCMDRSECLHLAASAGLSVNLNGEYRRVPLGALKIGKIAQGAGPIFSNDILQDDRLPNKQWMRENGLQSFAGYPLVVEGRVFGVLALFGTRAASPLMLQAIESICHGLAAVIARRQAEGALLAQERDFHLLADNVPALYSHVDRELRYRFVNKRHEEVFGLPVSGIVGKFVKEVVGEANFVRLEPHLLKALAGQASSVVYPMALPSADVCWMSLQCMPDDDGTGQIKGILVLASDVTLQKQAELRLEQSQFVLQEKQQELQTLTEKLLTAQDEERKRIARDLHDDFNQQLAALAVELETVERSLSGHLPESIPRQLSAIRADVGRLSDDLHDLAYKLHPSLLDHVGLEVAMWDHVAEFTKRTGLPATFTPREVPKVLSPEVKTNLFRVLQESLQNVFKHAQASEVTVRLSGSSKGIGVSVRDNGKGFDLESKDARVKGLGLTSMQERARLLGGFLRIHSRPNEGTKVCVWIPRSQEDA
jgi:PAS domain S-box-containing protein